MKTPRSALRTSELRNANEALTGLAFDLYERYSILPAIRAFFTPAGACLRVLDVGGNTPVLWEGFSSLVSETLPDALAVTVDVKAAGGLTNYAQGSAAHLPFGDGSFDLVCSFDMLEHLPRQDRAAALEEMLRVTRDGLSICFPFDSAANRRAEKMLGDFIELYLPDSLPQLDEHRQFGLPDRDEIRACLASAQYPVVSFGHGNTNVLAAHDADLSLAAGLWGRHAR